MKNIKLLFVLAVGTALFVSGLFVPVQRPVLKYLLMAAGAGIALVFYFITLLRVIRSPHLSTSGRIFWTIVIICVPMAGNVIYVMFSDLANARQNPQGTW